jgi:hypothetical protein
MDDLRSNLLSSVSFAAEAETFIDHVNDNKSTSAFAQAHAEYLAGEVGRIAQSLQESAPGPQAATTLQTTRTQLDRLRTELNLVRSNIGNKEALAVRKAHIEAIRRSLAKASSSL